MISVGSPILGFVSGGTRRDDDSPALGDWEILEGAFIPCDPRSGPTYGSRRPAAPYPGGQLNLLTIALRARFVAFVAKVDTDRRGTARPRGRIDEVAIISSSS